MIRKNSKYITVVTFIVLLILYILAGPFQHQFESKKPKTNDLYKFQWWLNNDGMFNYFEDDKSAWGIDKKEALKGIDLNIGQSIEQIEQKRPLLLAVLDTSIDINHPAIKNGLYLNKGEIEGDRRDNDANGYIDDYLGWDFYEGDNNIQSADKDEMIHGTATVGLLIGNDQKAGYQSLLGSFDAKVLTLRVLGGNHNSGNIGNIIEAIHYAEKMGATICSMPINIDIASKVLSDTIKNSSMLFVVSAGNEGLDLDKYGENYPTCYRLSNVISVANLRCDGELSNNSNFGKQYVDLAAPGTNILCATPRNGYGFYSGTSLSVCSVVSEAGLISIQTSNCSSADIIKKTILKNICLLSAVKDKVSTGGIPDIARAVDSLN